MTSIGIDFDNTIASYDALVYSAAVGRGLVPPGVGVSKNAVRDWLRAAGREDDWIALQGEIYGPLIEGAALFPGVTDFLGAARMRGADVFVISLKTRYPVIGDRHDLHRYAKDWMARRGLLDEEVTGLSESRIFFEPDQASKIARIRGCRCTHFIDDLPEFLADPSFPAGVVRIHFDPNGTSGKVSGCLRAPSWKDVRDHVFGCG